MPRNEALRIAGHSERSLSSRRQSCSSVGGVAEGQKGRDLVGYNAYSVIGEVVSHYRIVEELGSGGMGTVYKAEDTRLKRTVALKFLASDQFRDKDAKARFLSEAQAAAALNHPNICGVYEIEEVEDRLFMVLPFLEGESLDKRIEQGPLPIPDLLNVSLQVAQALQEAHSKGIVHRDVKPGNVMVQQKGQLLHCVLMDFGLARLSQGTRLTRAGSQLGTAAYMSPEQVEGTEVDQRSDIWSLGVLMYEMVAGQLPFPADYELAQFYAILNESPEPPTALRTGVPKELERSIYKCMSKAPGERYQTCTELIVDIRAAQKAQSSGASKRSGVRAVQAKPEATESQRASKSRLTVTHMALALCLGAAVAGTGTWLARPPASGGLGIPEYEVSRVTWDAGLTLYPGISSDGRLVAYSSDRDGGGHLDIWVEQTGGGGRVQVTDDVDEEVWPVFSPDSSMLAFQRGNDLYVIPSLGGSARFLAANGRFPAFSPDGTNVSFASNDGRLMVADLGGSEPRALQSGFSVVSTSQWMPDQQHILFAAVEPPNEYEWWITPVDGGERIPTNFIGFKRSALGLGVISIAVSPTWFEPGGSLLYGSRHTLWKIRLDSDSWRYTGRPHALSFGPSNLDSASVADDGTIALSTVNSDIGIWSMPVGQAADAALGTSLLSPTEPAALSVSRAGDRIVFVGRTGLTDVYVRDLPSGREINITNNQNRERGAVISADGMNVAYETRSRGNSEIRVYSFESGQSRLLCQSCGIPNDWSPDNGYLLVSDADRSRISRVSASDGESSELIRLDDGHAVDSARFSPDGRWIAFARGKEEDVLAQILVAPVNATTPITRSDCIDVTNKEHFDVMPRWSADGRSLYFLSNRTGNLDIWRVGLATDNRPRGEPQPVRTFDTTRFSIATIPYDYLGFDVGRDRIYFTLQELTGRIFLLQPKDAADGSSP